MTTTTTMTPREIDEILASLYDTVNAAEDALGLAWRSVHYAAGDKLIGRNAWRLTNAQALDAAKVKMAEASVIRTEEIRRVIDRLAACEAALTAALDATTPYHAEYARRPWSRFFLVSDGHIHSSMSCSTCNKGAARTRFGWNPELSGKSMAEAIAHFEAQAKGRSEVLCSVCFPDAPREWMVRPVDPNLCPGSGTFDYDRNARTTRLRYASGNGAVCSHCEQWKGVSTAGRLRKHNKA